MNLGSLTNEELLRIATSEIDSLTSTPLEVELLKRFESLVDAEAEHGRIVLALENINHTVESLFKLLEILEEFEAQDTDALRQKLERANKFYDIATDAGDVVQRLAQLINATT